jgi:hypothetical protein
VSVGTGLYRTTDGGDNWEFMGLGDSERIAKIHVNPEDGDVVYVCATGHLWSSNEERGVYKTTDGGENWERILYVDENTGCADLAVDPQDSDILYAAMWQFRRGPDFFNSGGPGSGLHKSSDGGETWKGESPSASPRHGPTCCTRRWRRRTPPCTALTTRASTGARLTPRTACGSGRFTSR